jgi:hypothetical protein
MADQPRTDPDAPSGGPNPSGGTGKRKPEAIRIAQRDIRLAEQALKDAKEIGSAEGIDLAEDQLKKARQALRTIQNADPGEDRQEARQDFMKDYFDRLGPEAASLAKRDPELRKLFDEAIRKGWDEGTFISELKKTDWWKDPKKGSSWRQAFDLEFNNPPGVWQESLDDAKNLIRKLADDTYDMVIDEETLTKMARRYLYQGWGKNDNEGLRVWLSSQFSKQSEAGGDKFKPGGMYTETYNTLRDAARAYGIERDGIWLDKTTRDILNPNSGYSDDDAWNELIAEAESLYPVFSGKLSKDRSVRDLGAGYINQLYRRLELGSPDEVDLMDPLLRKAFTTPNDKGEPALMPLWRFEQEIKKDDRWQYTTNALSTYSQIGSDLARMMGFVG